MRKDGSLVRTDDQRELVGVFSAYHRELDVIAVPAEELVEAATG